MSSDEEKQCGGKIVGLLHFQREKADVNKITEFLEKIDGKIKHLKYNKKTITWEYVLESNCTCEINQ